MLSTKNLHSTPPFAAFVLSYRLLFKRNCCTWTWRVMLSCLVSLLQLPDTFFFLFCWSFSPAMLCWLGRFSVFIHLPPATDPKIAKDQLYFELSFIAWNPLVVFSRHSFFAAYNASAITTTMLSTSMLSRRILYIASPIILLFHSPDNFNESQYGWIQY